MDAAAVRRPAARRAARRAISSLVEGRYKIGPGALPCGARRAARLQRRCAAQRGLTDWDAPTWRFEIGVGYSITRNVIAKGAWQRNGRDGGRVRRDALLRAHRWSIGSERSLRAWIAGLAVISRPPCAGGDRAGRQAASVAGSTSARARPARRAAARRRRRRARPARATCPTCAAAWCISRRRRAARSTSASRGARSWISATRRSCPHVLAITTGTVVDFPNSDRIYHNVFSLSKTKRFDLGPLRGRPLEVGPVRPPRHRPRVLRHPLAHERVHPRVQPPVLRRHRRRGPLPDRQRAARHLHVIAWNEGEASRPESRSTVPTAASVELDFALR